MRTIARVREIRDGRAWLACEAATAACSACSGGRGCALRWLARGETTLLEVPVDAAQGQRLVPGAGVAVEVDGGELLRAALLAYLVPLASLLTGAVAAAVLAPGQQGAAVLASVVGLVAGWTLSRTWLRRSPPRYRLQLEDGP
jgi:sigma-E factor negative regulatory protein RseC